MSAPTVAASGTHNTTDAVENTLATITTPGAYEFHVDLGALASTEQVRLRVKSPVLTGGTIRSMAYVDYTSTGSGAPEPTTRVLGPIACDQSTTFTFQRVSGANRAHPFKVMRVS